MNTPSSHAVAGAPNVDRLLRIIEMQNLIVSAGMGLERVMEVVVEHATGITGATGAVIEILEGDVFVCRAAAGTAQGALDYHVPRDGSLSGLCIARGAPIASPDTSVDPRVDRAVCDRIGAASMVCGPLYNVDEPVGVLSVVATEPNAFDDDVGETLTLLGRVIGASLHHASQYETVRHDSLHDVLTGLENRRAFDAGIATSVARFRRYGSPLCLAILDLDGFKSTNDRWGHASGDRALREVADVIRREKRAGDTCYRIGGDEFALIMPDTELDGAQMAADRVCKAIAAARIATGTIGISAGVVQLSGDDETTEQLIARADAALYEAKRGESRRSDA